MDSGNERIVGGLSCDKHMGKIKEAVCIQVEKVYDSCKEKDCVENAKVIFSDQGCIQRLIDNAINVKCRRAEIMDVYMDVEPVPFKRGFYSVDVKYFIKVTLDLFVPRRGGGVKIIPVNGLVVFDKKIILFGSEGNIKIFKSHFVEHGIDVPVRSSVQQDNLPVSKVEVAEPICLGAKIQDLSDKCFEHICCISKLPRGVAEFLESEIVEEEDIFDSRGDERGFPSRRIVATVGLFSIIKLVRNVQLLIPAFDFCVPKKKCIAATEENPCELFGTIEFPVDEFFPPQKDDFPRALELETGMQCCK